MTIRATTNSRTNEILIGRTKSEKIFIGAHISCFKNCKSALFGVPIRALDLSDEDAKWIIGALRKELANDPEGEVGDYMDNE